MAPKVDALQAACAAVSPAAVLLSSAEGKEIAARLALRVGAGLVTDAVDVEANQGPVTTQSGVRRRLHHPLARDPGHRGHHRQAQLGPGEAAPAARTIEELACFGPGDRHQDHSADPARI